MHFSRHRSETPAGSNPGAGGEPPARRSREIGTAHTVGRSLVVGALTVGAVLGQGHVAKLEKDAGSHISSATLHDGLSDAEKALQKTHNVVQGADSSRHGQAIAFGPQALLDRKELHDLVTLTPGRFAEAYPHDEKVLSLIGQTALKAAGDKSNGPTDVMLRGSVPEDAPSGRLIDAAVLGLAYHDTGDKYPHSAAKETGYMNYLNNPDDTAAADFPDQVLISAATVQTRNPE